MFYQTEKNEEKPKERREEKQNSETKEVRQQKIHLLPRADLRRIVGWQSDCEIQGELYLKENDRTN